MELICPACQARFRVDASRIGPTGRKVRCGRCQHEWVQHRPEEGPVLAAAGAGGMAAGALGAAVPALETGASSDSPLAMKAFAPGTGSLRLGDDGAGAGSLLAGWLLFFLVAGAILLGAWYKREWIVENAPAAAQIYALMGIEVGPPLEALQLYDVTSVRRTVEGQRLLVVEGKILNTSEQTLLVPELQAEISAPDGEVLVEWRFVVDEGELLPGASATFETSTQNPPREGNLAIVFVGAPS